MTYWKQFVLGDDPATLNHRTSELLTEVKRYFPEAETMTYPGAGVMYVHVWLPVCDDPSVDEVFWYFVTKAKSDYEGPL